jgi:hypothetical protein
MRLGTQTPKRLRFSFADDEALYTIIAILFRIVNENLHALAVRMFKEESQKNN